MGPRCLDKAPGLISGIFWLKILDREGTEDDPKEATQSHLGLQSKGRIGGPEGRAHAGRAGRAVRCSPQSDPGWKKRLSEGAQNVFGSHAVAAQHNDKEVEKLHAKIGQLAMENDFLSGFLGRDR